MSKPTQENLWGEPEVAKSPSPNSAKGESKTRNVEVIVPPTIQVSKAGKRFARLAVKVLDRDKDYLEIFQVLAFDTADRCKDLKVGDKVTMTLGPGDDPKVCFLWGLFVPGQKAPAESPKARIVREYGSLENFRKKRKEEIEERKARGFVPVHSPDSSGKLHFSWEREEDCVFVGFKWKLKIDYVLDRIPPEQITAELRKLAKGAPIDLFEGSAEFARVRVRWGAEYKAWLNEKIRFLTGQELKKEVPFP